MKQLRRKVCCGLFIGLLTCAALVEVFGQAENTSRRPLPSYNFDFGGDTRDGYVRVTPGVTYSPGRGYGIDLNTNIISKTTPNTDPSFDGYCTSEKPFFFSVKVPEGNYRVKITVGDDLGMSDASIRAECRRMMVNRVQTATGEHRIIEFTLNIRDSIIHGLEKSVRLKKRELNYLHWDDKLTLEFNGPLPKINTIEITPESEEVITVFLAGNSTVVDGAYEPYAAWGQMIPSFFKPGKVSIANYAESGETLSSFIAERRFDKMLGLMKKGDYVFVEFGHNDQKQKGEGIGAFTSYKKDLEYFIGEVKKKGATPVVVTSLQRRRFDSNGLIEETLGAYPEAGRQTAKEQDVPLIDLNAMSKIMYEAWGPVESVNAFVHFPANSFPNQPNALEDNTHFRPFGAYEVAKLVVKGIRDCHLELSRHIFNNVPIIDPAKPGTLSSFYWPLSPNQQSNKPEGN